jgi:hypothetical protein
MVLTNIVKHIVSLVVLLFFTYLIGAKLFDRFWLNPGSLREGLEGTSTEEPTTIETCKIPEASKSIELAAAFEKVGKQMDMIRSIRESTTPAVPIKIDKDADPNFLVLINLKLLVNNGISVNEASLKSTYDQYIGNREVALLTTDLNSLKLETKSADAERAKEEGFLCRVKIIIEGHQKIIDSILEKKSDE